MATKENIEIYERLVESIKTQKGMKTNIKHGSAQWFEIESIGAGASIVSAGLIDRALAYYHVNRIGTQTLTAELINRLTNADIRQSTISRVLAGTSGHATTRFILYILDNQERHGE